MAKKIAVIIKSGLGDDKDTKKSVILKTGSTVGDALDAAGNTIKDGTEVRLEGEVCSMSDKVKDGEVITLFAKIKGA